MITIDTIINLSGIAIAVIGGIITLNRNIAKIETKEEAYRNEFENKIASVKKDAENEIRLIRQLLEAERQRVDVEFRAQQVNLEHLNRAGENLKEQMTSFIGTNVRIVTTLDSLTLLVKDIQADLKELQQKKQ